MKLINVIELIRDVANAHPDIEAFHTGLPSERNTRVDDFPALRINFPYTYTPIMDDNGESNRASITLDLELFVNTSKENDNEDSHEIVSDFGSQDPTYNEIDTELVEETLQREFALSIMSHVVHSLRNYSNECGSFYQIETSSFISLERDTTNRVTGVGCTLSFDVFDEYKCETEEFIVIGGTVEPPHICPTLPLPKRYSMDFNGINQYGQISQSNSTIYDLDWTQPFTFEGWYFHELGQTAHLLSKINIGAGYFFGVVGARDVLRFQLRTSSPSQIIDVNSTDTLSAGWNHITMTWNGGGSAEQDVTFTINDVVSPKPNDWSQGNQLTAGTISTTALLEVQKITGFNIYGKGLVSHIRLWNNVELNSTEINKLYNNGRILYDNVPQAGSILFETGFADENHAWYGANGWIMQELSGSSNFVYGVNSTINSKEGNIPS